MTGKFVKIRKNLFLHIPVKHKAMTSSFTALFVDVRVGESVNERHRLCKFVVCIFCLNFGIYISRHTCTSRPMLALITLQCFVL